MSCLMRAKLVLLTFGIVLINFSAVTGDSKPIRPLNSKLEAFQAALDFTGFEVNYEDSLKPPITENIVREIVVDSILIHSLFDTIGSRVFYVVYFDSIDIRRDKEWEDSTANFIRSFHVVMDKMTGKLIYISTRYIYLDSLGNFDDMDRNTKFMKHCLQYVYCDSLPNVYPNYPLVKAMHLARGCQTYFAEDLLAIYRMGYKPSLGVIPIWELNNYNVPNTKLSRRGVIHSRKTNLTCIVSAATGDWLSY